MTIDGDTSGDKYDPANPTTEESTEDVGTADELKVSGLPKYVPNKLSGLSIHIIGFSHPSVSCYPNKFSGLSTHWYNLVQSTYT